MERRRRIMLVFGTRPEAIKMAPVYKALCARPDRFEVLCCVTGQHREMLDQMLATFGIVPDVDLDLMREGQDLAELSAAVLISMTAVLREHAPDVVLVHGDTTTSMASALAAFYQGIRVGHVEAGLRSNDMCAPFPEEFNRRATALTAAYHFAPTPISRANLLAEGADPASIVVTGNTVVDALRTILARIDGDPAFRVAIEQDLDREVGIAWRTRRCVLVTCHRRENVVHGLKEVSAALDELSRSFPDVRFVFPVHANPAIGGQLRPLLGRCENIHLIAPLRYDAFLHLLRHCHCVLTDSGGLQEEALILGKPALVMRAVTERPEVIAAGGARLIGTGQAEIVAGATELLLNPAVYTRMARAANPFGEGTAGEQIADFLDQRLTDATRIRPA